MGGERGKFVPELLYTCMKLLTNNQKEGQDDREGGTEGGKKAKSGSSHMRTADR